jgi:ABC-type antimicrobial peptide transport system permease subunit
MSSGPFRVFHAVSGLFWLLAGASFALAMIAAFAMVGSDLVSRRRELGIRMAVGASSAELLSCILRQHIVVAVGTAAMTALAFVWLRVLIERFVGSVLLGWPPEAAGPWQWILCGIGVLMLFGLAIAVFGATRVSRLDPARLIRETQ